MYYDGGRAILSNDKEGCYIKKLLQVLSGSCRGFFIWFQNISMFTFVYDVDLYVIYYYESPDWSNKKRQDSYDHFIKKCKLGAQNAVKLYDSVANSDWLVTDIFPNDFIKQTLESLMWYRVAIFWWEGWYIPEIHVFDDKLDMHEILSSKVVPGVGMSV